MKRELKNTLLIIALLLSLKGLAQDNAVISGTIVNPPTDTVVLTIDKYYIGEKQEIITEKAVGGSFRFTFEPGKGRMVELFFNKQTLPLYVEPGDNLSIKFSADSIASSVKFSGTGSAHNQFLQEFDAKFGKDLSEKDMKPKILNTGIDNFELTIYDTKTRMTNFYNSYPQKSELSATFRKYIENTTYYNYLNYLLAYPIIRGNNSKDPLVQALPKIMLDAVEETKVNNEEALVNESYRSFIGYYITYFTSQENSYKKFTDYNSSIEKKCYTARNKLTGNPYLFFVAKYLSDFCTKISKETYEKVFGYIKEADKEGVYTAIFKEKKKNILFTEAATPTSGEPVSDAIKNLKLKDLDGKMVSLDDFKGKVVAIDFWASWCGPCRQQFPFSKEMKKKLTEAQKKKIVFLYISIDDKEDSWKNAIKQNEIEGTHLLSPGGWRSDAVKYFKISSIPRYMIMDQKGNLVNDNAKRPSDPDCLNEILELIK